MEIRNIKGYKITEDTGLAERRYGYDENLRKQMETLFYEAQDKKNKKITGKLTQLIKQYPNVPVLKNYLSSAYNIQGNFEKAKEIHSLLLTQHPDYVFGIVNQASIFINEKQYDKIPDLLGSAFDIKALFPDREVFHLTEVTTYIKVAILYFVSIENLEQAEKQFDLLQEIAEDHPDTDIANKLLFTLRLKKAGERRELENKNRITPGLTVSLPASENSLPPVFNHPEILELYKYNLKISHEKLEIIIGLPRQTLIEDLEKILKDAVDRYNYFRKKKYDENLNSFVVHALFLLKEVKAEESLPEVFSFLSSPEEVLDYWLGDHISESLWQCIYSLGLNKTDDLKDFLIQPGNHTYVKSATTEALCQMVHRHDEKRDDILAVFSEVLTVFANASFEDNLIDSSFLGLAIADALDCDLFELLPLIKVLYEKNYVSLGICGDYHKVEAEFSKHKKRFKRKLFANIYEHYDSILNNWSGYQEDNDNFYSTNHQQAVSTKIGRNDPCPCGSGKKYKKCCLNKE